MPKRGAQAAHLRKQNDERVTYEEMEEEMEAYKPGSYAPWIAEVETAAARGGGDEVGPRHQVRAVWAGV
jgi:hypothetical protein